jgi:MFS family permease
MLGLFMLIPVFTVYATQLTSATPTLIGIALGSYGLSQGLLQIPFGMLSDRFGRKPIITLGLILFVCGSLLGAFSTSIYSMIIARILQGTGAIGSVLIALLADLTPDEQRTKAMAVIGVTIGMSFSLAMILSPAITHYFGLAGIFYLTAFLATFGLILLHGVIPNPKKEPFHLDSEANPVLFLQVLGNAHLQRLNLGIFCQHFILTATFFAIPILLQQQMKAGHLAQQWHFYLPLMVLSFLVMVPFLTLAEKKRKIKPVFLVSVIVTCICQFILAFTYQQWWAICSLMFVYFVVFNILEASLPSLVSRQASAESKGTAMGIYSSSQFLGIFAGGALAGVLYQFAGSQGIFFINGAISLLWLTVAFYLKPDVYQITLVLPYDNTRYDTTSLSNKLSSLTGVIAVVVTREESTIYLRLDKALYLEGSANQIIRQWASEANDS